jgi:hypothetical protein
LVNEVTTPPNKYTSAVEVPDLRVTISNPPFRERIRERERRGEIIVIIIRITITLERLIDFPANG